MTDPANEHSSGPLPYGATPPLREVLARISGLHLATGPDVLDGILKQGTDAKAVEAALALLRDLRERFMADAERGPAIPTPIARTFSSAEYVIPKELESIHPAVLEHLKSGKGNDAAPFVGLLLHGVMGTGKSEYAQFLAGAAPEHIQVVTVSVAAIRNAASPGEALRDLYQNLDAEAALSGKYMVVLFDEFDQMITRGAFVHSSERIEETGRHSDKRSETHTVRQKTDSIEIDAVGEEVLSAFKSILGSTGGIKRVFTVVTSNMDHFPEPMYREGRLNKIELKAPTLELAPGSRDLPIYSTYQEVFDRALRVMAATRARLHTTPCAALGAFASEFHAVAEKFPMDQYDWRHLGLGGVPQEFKVANNAVLDSMLAVVGAPNFDKLSRDAQESFAGRFVTRGDDRNYGRAFLIRGEYFDLPNLQIMTPSKIAGLFKARGADFADVEQVREFMRTLFFPQTEPDWERRKSW